MSLVEIFYDEVMFIAEKSDWLKSQGGNGRTLTENSDRLRIMTEIRLENMATTRIVGLIFTGTKARKVNVLTFQKAFLNAVFRKVESSESLVVVHHHRPLGSQ